MMLDQRGVVGLLPGDRIGTLEDIEQEAEIALVTDRPQELAVSLNPLLLRHGRLVVADQALINHDDVVRIDDERVRDSFRRSRKCITHVATIMLRGPPPFKGKWKLISLASPGQAAKIGSGNRALRTVK